jgi:hypothetical protein
MPEDFVKAISFDESNIGDEQSQINTNRPRILIKEELY